MKALTENVHYYFNEEGFVVFTRQYHLEKGYCCGHGCQHCPFEYESVPEPRRSSITQVPSPLVPGKDLP